MKNILFNLFLLVKTIYKSFGIIPMIIFIIFLLFIILFIVFELAQSFLPFTYVAF